MDQILEEMGFLASVREAWLRDAAGKRQAEEKRRGQALAAAGRVAGYLREKYRVKAVYLYGSLTWGKHFTDSSDIDLLVEGFPREADYWRALVEAEGIASSFPVSIVLAEDASPGLYTRAVKEGTAL